MSNKKIIDMDDLMSDNLSLDSLTSLPNVADTVNDWKHKGDDTSAHNGDSVDELDVSAVDFSVLDPEQEDSGRSNYTGNTYFQAASEDTAPAPSPAPPPPPAPPKFTPPSGGITVGKINKPAGGFEVGKISVPSAPAEVEEVVKDESAEYELTGLNLPPLKKVSLDAEAASAAPPPPAPAPVSVPKTPISVPQKEIADLPPMKPINIPQKEPVELPPRKPISVPQKESVELPPLSSAPAPQKKPVELPPGKPISVPQKEAVDLPPLKPAAPTPQKESVDLPPLKPAAPPPKKESVDLPPLKPAAPPPKKESADLPPLKPAAPAPKKPADLPPVTKKTEEAAEKKDSSLPPVTKVNAGGDLPDDMSDVVAPKLDDMMSAPSKKASFENPENNVKGMQNPFENANMSAARRKKLEEGFDAPITMKHGNAEAIKKREAEERREHSENGKKSIMGIAIIYIILNIAEFATGFLNAGFDIMPCVALVLSIAAAVIAIKGIGPASVLYTVAGAASSGVSFMGISGILPDLAGAGLMGMLNAGTGALAVVCFIIGAVTVFTNKNVKVYFETLKE